jgi:hypothetical protein
MTANASWNREHGAGMAKKMGDAGWPGVTWNRRFPAVTDHDPFAPEAHGC